MGKHNKLKSIVTLLDIGTSKICCMIVKFGTDGIAEVIGTGYTPASGIQAGAIIDKKQATECISNALAQAHKQADFRPKSVVVNISSTQMKSHHIFKEIEISDNKPITANDVKSLVDKVISSCLAQKDEVVHAFPLEYVVDNERNVQDPRGLYATRLGVHMYIITLPESQSRNLVSVLDSCLVSVDMKVATPYAAALACVNEDEKEAGVTVVDFGAGTTSIAMFLNGGLVHLDLIPQGGNVITKDIVQGLKTSFAVAERQKTLNGAAFLSPRDEIDKLIIPMLGEESTNVQIPQSRLISIIIPRLEEILGNIKRVFEKYPYFGVATKQIVLSGGGSMLQGIQEKTATILNSTVRIGKPETIRGLSSQFEVYTFSTCIGLLKYVMIKEKSLLNEKFKSQSTPKKGFIGKVTQWLIQNF